MSNFIVQAILDVHYESSYPTVALFGELYNLGYKNVTETPFRNIPKEVRDNNPDFKHQAMYEVKSEKKAFKVHIGDNTFGISTENYTSWSDFLSNAKEVFSVLFTKHESNLKISRIGLRYLDMIENHNIFNDEHIKLEISGADRKKTNTINLRFEDIVGDCNVIENIIYPFKAPKNKEITGTFIDIVTAQHKLLLEGSDISKKFVSISDDLHTINKNKFKEILSNELRKQINL